MLLAINEKREANNQIAIIKPEKILKPRKTDIDDELQDQ